MGGLTRPVGFDLQAHRGGAGLWPENTLEAFDHALALGVTTLECDVHVTADGVAVLCHERTWRGRLVPRSTYASFDGIATLAGLAELVHERGAEQVWVDAETKFDVLHPAEEAPREVFVETLVEVLGAAGLLDRATVQSFDWAVLRLVAAREPRLGLNALTNADRLEVDEPGASPWLAGIDIDDFADSVPAAVSFLGFDAISPSHTILTPAMVAEAHAAGLRVLPWTVDAPATMRRLLDLGVDGMITNRPDVLRDELAARGEPLPPAHPPLA